MPFQKIPEDFQVWTSKELNEYLQTTEDQLQFAKMFPGDDPDFLSSLEMGVSACRSELARRNQNGARPPPPVKKRLVQVMETIEEEEVDFLWDRRIPRGKLTDFSGDPGLGKSTVCLAIAAALSRGDTLPFDKPLEAPLRTLIISAEDGARDTLKPRLRKMDADMSMIGIPNLELNLTPSQIDPGFIDLMLSEFPAALCIIDPIIAFTGKKNTNNAAEVRSILSPLAMITEKHKTATVMIRHLNKASVANALYRGQGSMDFAAVCRSMFTFGKDPENKHRRFMAHMKCNIAGLQPTLEFFIDDNGIFSWGSTIEQTADDIITPPSKKGPDPEKRGEAKTFVTDLLVKGPMPSNEIRDLAEKRGISWRTIWRANEELKAEGKMKVFKEKETGAWFWRLTS